MGTIQKQKQIRMMLDLLGWSQRQLAEVLYEELKCEAYENIDDMCSNEVRKFRDVLKKQLQRPSTPVDRLDQYIQVISEHPDFLALNADVVLPKYVKHSCLIHDVMEDLIDISDRLDDTY